MTSRETQKEKQQKKRNLIGALIVIIGALCVTLMVMILSVQYQVTRQLGDASKAAALRSRHYALLLTDGEDSFWSRVCEGADAQAAELDAVVERMATEEIGDTLAKQLYLAIARNVDGIIIRPDGSNEVSELMHEAREKGIPVITVMNEWNGYPYVGVNSYDMGKKYGEHVIKLAENGAQVVMLLPEKQGAANEKKIFFGLMDTLKSTSYRLRSYSVNLEDTFSAELDIQTLLNEENPPDILICPNTNTALSAYRIVVDSNKVGKVKLLVGSVDETILDAIDKGGVDTAITLDAELLGKNCVRIMDELATTGRTGNFTVLELQEINREKREGEATE